MKKHAPAPPRPQLFAADAPPAPHTYASINAVLNGIDGLFKPAVEINVEVIDCPDELKYTSEIRPLLAFVAQFADPFP